MFDIVFFRNCRVLVLFLFCCVCVLCLLFVVRAWCIVVCGGGGLVVVGMAAATPGLCVCEHSDVVDRVSTHVVVQHARHHRMWLWHGLHTCTCTVQAA